MIGFIALMVSQCPVLGREGVHRAACKRVNSLLRGSQCPVLGREGVHHRWYCGLRGGRWRLNAPCWGARVCTGRGLGCLTAQTPRSQCPVLGREGVHRLP